MTPTATRLLILGANGPSGRRTVQQALDRGYAVVALTRHPEAFPISHERREGEVGGGYGRVQGAGSVWGAV